MTAVRGLPAPGAGEAPASVSTGPLAARSLSEQRGLSLFAREPSVAK